MQDRFDGDNYYGVMYESAESRYATELVNVIKGADLATEITIDFKTASAVADCGYVPGGEAVYVHTADGKYCAAMRTSESHKHGVESWMTGVIPTSNGVNVTVTVVDFTNGVLTLSFSEVPAGATYSAIARYNSEADLLGKHLGEVELQVRDYHFRPRPVSLGVTWTQLSELVLDSSFGVSAEEMLMDFASQEIKKTLDFQAVKLADAAQKVSAADNCALFDAEAGGNTKDSYYHTAQLIGQAINRIGDLQLNKINRGGVSAIVGGPAAVEYLKLSQVWKDTGRQASIGGHKCGEYDGKLWNAIKKVA